MNLDALLLDIIKDKSRGHFNDNVEEVMKTQYSPKDTVLRESIYMWFGIIPSRRYLNHSAKTAHGRQVQKNVRNMLPYHNQVRCSLILTIDFYLYSSL